MNGIDCATRLTSSSAQVLKSSGVEVVGRYLGHTLSKGLTSDEVKAIHGAGLDLFLIFELSPLEASYFTFDKGVSDAKFALQEAENLGVPQGVCIYFTVDYEAQSADMSAIAEYLHGIHTILTGKYLVGVYGSYAVINAMKGANYPPDRYFQTYAWSYGAKVPNHIYQYKNNVMVGGVYVDEDYVNDDAGLWSKNIVDKVSENDMLDVCVLLNTKEDFWDGFDVSVKNGYCPIVVRPNPTTIPDVAMKAKHLIVVGGSTTGHQNEKLLNGNDKYDTAAAVKKYLG
ncbi:glycoside hydrolase domain-containing protein [Desulfosporosinus sp. FKA]|uniref:glycoside hydrolase domain-containing protein n=1 Tax=Desulfosporosinus sp. FKA TaxID=1969834 RepID=UPI001551CB14|nr:glycoside hydrolase domain-containing protein [Desulfosporosinus sp. FKA]